MSNQKEFSFTFAPAHMYGMGKFKDTNNVLQLKDNEGKFQDMVLYCSSLSK
jgi:hypothetical protein